MEWSDPEEITLRFQVACRCINENCGEIAIATGSGGVSREPDDFGKVSLIRFCEIKSFFPAPQIIQVPQIVPPEVTAHLSASFPLYWVDIAAAANALRNSLEALLDKMEIPRETKNSKGKKHRLTLHARIDLWAAKNPTEAELCHALKEVGNLGSHGDKLERDEFLGAMELFEYVLHELYENRAQKMKSLAAKLQIGISARKTPDTNLF